MSIESIIEHRAMIPSTGGSITVDTTAGSSAITGANLDTLDDGDIIVFTDNAGTIRTEQIAGTPLAASGNIENNAQSDATAATVSYIAVANQTSYFFRGDNSNLKSSIISVPTDNTLLATPEPTPRSKINVNEGVLLKSIYLRCPYQYTMADGPIRIVFGYYDSAGSYHSPVTVLGEGGTALFIPVENVEIPVNTYIPIPSGLGTDWQLSASIQRTKPDAGDTQELKTFNFATLSNVNAPDALNGQIMPVIVGARIQHAATALTS